MNMARPDTVRVTSSAWQLKLSRARQHHAELKRELARLEADPPYELVPTREANDVVVRVAIKGAIPSQPSLVVGDLLHNARSALDVLVFDLARAGAETLGRLPTAKEEREISFPVTADPKAYERFDTTLAKFLSPSVRSRIADVQPWRMAETVREDGSPPNDREQSAAEHLNLLRRLSVLNNLDKHRVLLFTLWRPSSVRYGDLGLAGDAGSDRSWDNDAAPPDPAVLAELEANLEAERERGETVDFYFADEAITDGAEVGRFRRNDHGRVPDGLKIRGNLRLVLWEPDLTDQSIGGPAISVLSAEFINEVEAVCTYVSGSPTAGP